MKYVMLEVGGNGRIQGEYPALDIVEEYEDWEDVIDNCGTEGLVPLGDGCHIYVDLNRRDPSRGEPYYEIKGIIVPENAVGNIKSLDEHKVSQ